MGRAIDNVSGKSVIENNGCSHQESVDGTIGCSNK